ncbi:MAG: hypothetical protein AAFV72_03855 [Cyanobacteria bacterium J06635_1]
MGELKIAIKGAAAPEAAASLFEIDGLEGGYETDPAVSKDGGLTVIATVVGIVGGTVALAEQIRQWYVAYKQRQDVKTIDKVLIVTPHGRFLLKDASIEEIAQALEPLAK